jgi:protein disulfide-isomerase A6
MGVSGFPTLKIVRPGKTPGKPIVEDYQGPRTAKGIVDAVLEKIPNLVKKVDDKSLEGFLEEANETAKAILFTDKGKTSALIKSVAIEFKGSIAVAQIRNTEKASVSLFGIDTFPTLLLLPGGKEAEGIVYAGELKKEPIIEFLSTATSISPNPDPAAPKVKVSKSKDSKKESKKKEDFESASKKHAKEDGKTAGASATEEVLEEEATPSPEPIVEAEKPIQLPDPAPSIGILANEAQLEEVCLGPKTGTCVLALLPNNPDSVAGVAIGSLSEIAHRAKLLRHNLFPFYALPEVNPAYAKIKKVLGLESEFEIIAINGKRGWYKSLPRSTSTITAESVSEEVLENWVEGIKLGEGAKIKLPAGLIPEEPEEEFVFDGVVIEEEVVEEIKEKLEEEKEADEKIAAEEPIVIEPVVEKTEEKEHDEL